MYCVVIYILCVVLLCTACLFDAVFFFFFFQEKDAIRVSGWFVGSEVRNRGQTGMGEVADQPYHVEDDIYAAANDVAGEGWSCPFYPPDAPTEEDVVNSVGGGTIKKKKE